MMKMLAACAAVLVAAGSAHAADTFHFALDGTAWHDVDPAACKNTPDTCEATYTPLHETYTYTVPGDGDWSFHHGGLSVRDGQVTDFFQNLGDCDMTLPDWSVWHDCSHGQLIDEDGAAYGYYLVFGQIPGFSIAGWTASLSVTSDISAVPEPSHLALLLAGGALLAARRRRG